MILMNWANKAVFLRWALEGLSDTRQGHGGWLPLPSPSSLGPPHGKLKQRPQTHYGYICVRALIGRSDAASAVWNFPFMMKGDNTPRMEMRETKLKLLPDMSGGAQVTSRM